MRARGFSPPKHTPRGVKAGPWQGKHCSFRREAQKRPSPGLQEGRPAARDLAEAKAGTWVQPGHPWALGLEDWLGWESGREGGALTTGEPWRPRYEGKGPAGHLPLMSTPGWRDVGGMPLPTPVLPPTEEESPRMHN